jgi:hypothetical protein
MTEATNTSTDVLALLKESREVIAKQEELYRNSIAASERKTEECLKAKQSADQAIKLAEAQISESRKSKEKCDRAIDLMAVAIAEIETQNSLLQIILQSGNSPIIDHLKDINTKLSMVSNAMMVLLRDGRSGNEDESNRLRNKLIDALGQAAQARVNLGTNFNVDGDLKAKDITGRDKHG